jgi:glutathione S-transferase
VQCVFQQVGDRLGDGRRFLVADRFTAADLTFAALAAPVLLPDECRAVSPAFDDVPGAMREAIQRLRDTDAGRFALRLFAEERGRSCASATARVS